MRRPVEISLILNVDSFSWHARWAGERLFDDDFVELAALSPVRAIAQVKPDLVVQLVLVEGLVSEWHCSCSERGGVSSCEHVWAGALALEDHFLQQRGLGQSPWFESREDEDRSESPEFESSPATLSPGETSPRTRPTNSWRRRVQKLSEFQRWRSAHWARNLTGEAKVIFWLEQPRGTVLSTPVVRALVCYRRKGSWQPPEPLGPDAMDHIGGADLHLLHELAAFRRQSDEGFAGHADSLDSGGAAEFRLEGPLGAQILKEVAATGRLWWSQADPEREPPLLLDTAPWEARLAFETPTQVVDQDEFRALRGSFRRGADRSELEAVQLLHPGGVFVTSRVMSQFEAGEGIELWGGVDSREPLLIPTTEVPRVTRQLLAHHPEIPLEIPDEVEVQRSEPRPRLVIRDEGGRRKAVVCDLYFDYGDGVVVEAEDPELAIRTQDTIVARHIDRERELLVRLLELGARRSIQEETLGRVTIARSQMGAATETLLGEDWIVELEGKVCRSEREFHIQVESGKDWFNVNGTVCFGGEVVPFARVLGALRCGKNLIRLDDGSLGLLSVALRRSATALASLGECHENGIRLRAAQGHLLDALLAELPQVDGDQQFRKLRQQIERFRGLKARRESRGFRGQLRPYQREALGWLRFLRDFGLGGCLADDMGLGKTIQVIAHLDALGATRALAGPILVVTPRSVIGHWMREISRFTTRLRPLDYSRPSRRRTLAQPGAGDVILTTYAILRRDITKLTQHRWDTVVLDEAQAIKNRRSQTHKAARLLVASHRVAISGTPIENHVGDLWSLFEFLQPGLMGEEGHRVLHRQAPTEGMSADEAAGRFQTIARAVRPFVLRRTKSQVAPELPPRSEQILECELAARQRVLYDELAEHLRATLLRQECHRGLARMSLQALEGLLRLRQIACHPALVDPFRAQEASGKLDVLMARVQSFAAEGHRCLVFSQFTELLHLARGRFRRAGIQHEYLDGKTSDRQERIDRFQNGTDTAFLISLRAGSAGITLTAADYVFLLDPWWNPAVEAQAIDRTHRIGQTKRVVAYRLIAPNTVEQKMLELQAEKQALAERVLPADPEMPISLQAADLEFLLS